MYKLKVILFTSLALATGILFATFEAASPTLNYFQLGSDNISVEEIQPIQNAYNQCYVNVAVFNSPSHKYGLANATVTVLSGRKQSSSLALKYTGFSRGTTDSYGLVCVLVYCHEQGLIFVEKDGIRIFASSMTSQQSHLPPMFRVDIKYANEVIHFYSFVWGTINGHAGPVYTNNEHTMCKAASKDDYHFTFSYISPPDQLVSTFAPVNTTDLNATNAWYYTLPGAPPNFCYLKIFIKTKSTQLSVYGYNRLNDDTGLLLGLFVSGLQYDISSTDTTSKAVCLEFRCPNVALTGQAMNTNLIGKIVNANGKEIMCCPVLDKVKNQFTLTGSFFKTTFLEGYKYGPELGVYMATTKQQARARCYTGHDFLGQEYAMDVHKGFAIEYDCTSTCTNQPIVG